MSNLTSQSFPHNKLEALTMLYLQNQDISRMTPVQLLDKYQSVYDELKAYDQIVRENRQS